MKLHNFSQTAFQSKATPGKPFVAHGCDSFEIFQASRPGKFVDAPVGFDPCQPGFRHYQTDSGQVIGVLID